MLLVRCKSLCTLKEKLWHRSPHVNILFINIALKALKFFYQHQKEQACNSRPKQGCKPLHVNAE